MKTPVVFRRWKDTGSIIALFPTIAATAVFCESYEHVGQHGGADYHGVIAATKPATDFEARHLHAELTRIGYDLKPIKRASYTHHQQRRNSL